MKDEDAKAAAGILIVAGIAVVGYWIFRQFVSGEPVEGALGIGEEPQSAGSASADNNGGIGPCRAVLRDSFHVRPQEQAGTQNSIAYRGNTEVIILQRGSLTRGLASMYRVRVPRTNREGWVFILPGEIAGNCRPAAGAASPASATPAPSPANAARQALQAGR